MTNYGLSQIEEVNISIKTINDVKLIQSLNIHVRLKKK